MASVPLSFSIDSQGTIERVRHLLTAMPEGVERARKRALRKLMTWLQRQVLRAASQASEIPQKTLKVLLRYSAKHTEDGGIRIWVGADPIKVHHLGTVRWTPAMKGARAGKRSFPGTWSWGAGSRTGPAIMRRTGDARLPIEPVTREVYQPIYTRLEGMQPEISARYERLMLQELNYALRYEAARA
jgi:hypothetical protein